MSRPQLHRRRPAETTAGGVGVLIVVVAQLFGLNLTDQQLQALIVLVGLVPALVTYFVGRRPAPAK